MQLNGSEPELGNQPDFFQEVVFGQILIILDAAFAAAVGLVDAVRGVVGVQWRVQKGFSADGIAA